MDESNLNCPKCNGEMEDGFIADHTYGAVLQNDWVEGEPVWSIWTGMKIKDRKQYKVTTYRCARCGYLESYATEEKSKNGIFS